MPKMSEIRAKFPMYEDVSDDQLLIALRKKYYSDIPSAQFYGAIERDTERERLQKANLDEMGWGGQALAGAGKSVATLGRTLKRMIPGNDYTAESVAEDAKYDKQLADTSGGFWGGVGADVAMTAIPGSWAAKGIGAAGKAAGAANALAGSARALPRAVGAFTRGAAPYAGAAGSGAAVGAALNPEDFGQGAALGAAMGPLGELGGRVAAAGYRGAKAVVEPMWQAGRERVLKRTLERYATDLPGVRRTLANPPAPLVPGTAPTLAETTMDPGLIQLQRASQSVSPEVASALDASNLQRVGAYREALDQMAGNQGQRQAAEAARRQVGSTMYDDAFSKAVDMDQVAPEVAQRVQTLLRRPSIQRAMPRAVEDAAEQGLPFDGTSSIRGLHQIKMALDDEIGEAVIAGKNTRALEGTRDELLTLLDDLSEGTYDAARGAYAKASRPVNQMQIAERLREKAFPALSEYSPNITRTRPEQYARALEDTMQTTRRATGMKNLAIEDVLDPQQLGTVQGIGKDMARYSAVQETARIPGSPTAQLMAAQNVLRGLLGPMGLPESALDSQLGKLTSGVMGLPYKWTEPQLQQMLGRALTDPREAARLLAAPDPRTVAEILQPYAAQAAIQVGVQQQRN